MMGTSLASAAGASVAAVSVDAVVVVAEELPQAHSARTMHRAITNAIIFFIVCSSKFKNLK
jgi:hypothetical protein